MPSENSLRLDQQYRLPPVLGEASEKEQAEAVASPQLWSLELAASYDQLLPEQSVFGQQLPFAPGEVNHQPQQQRDRRVEASPVANLALDEPHRPGHTPCKCRPYTIPYSDACTVPHARAYSAGCGQSSTEAPHGFVRSRFLSSFAPDRSVSQDNAFSRSHASRR